MDIRIHPLVVLHIADHYTREFQQKNQTRVMGCLMGKQEGRLVQIYDAFEIPHKENAKTGVPTLDHETFKDDMKLYKEVFPRYECLGWYVTDGKITQMHHAVHDEMKQYNERPLLMLFDPKVDPNARDLSCKVYEQVVHVAGDRVTSMFLDTQAKVESEEAERVTAVHCAKVISNVDTGASAVAPHYTTLRAAVATLNSRVRVIALYLREVAANKIEADQKILRLIKGLTNRLPSITTREFKQDFLSEYNDALLVTYLASVTRSTCAVNEVVEKFNVAHGSGRRRAPMFFA